MKIHPYLLFGGQCEEAFNFYAKALGAKIITMMTYGDSPMPEMVPADFRGKIIHATLAIGDQMIMASDAPPDRFKPPQGFSVSIEVSDPAEAERLFGALSEGASVGMPMQQTFWSPRFGMLVDQFGIPWMVNCNQAS
jgi:PhnB protein